MGVRVWLRRVMPRAAVASAALFAVWLLIHNRSFYRQGIVGQLFSFALALIFFTSCYYGFKGLRWLKRRVMWRVRRRLVITYLFVGLTPIVLLFTLAVIINFVGLSQVMTRVVKVQLADKENQSLANARTLAEAFLRLPQNGDKRTAQAWLDERVAMLQSSLPGARVAVWANANAADESSAVQFVSEPRDERVRPLGGDAVPLNSPLPDWLRGRDEWSGFAYLPPLATSTEAFGMPSVRAFVRARTSNREVALLLVLPVSRVFVEQLRRNTDLHVQPFFLGADIAAVKVNQEWFGASSISIGKPESRRASREHERSFLLVEGARTVKVDFSKDQLGEPVNTGSTIVLPATHWPDGAVSQRAAFLCKFSAGAMAKQLFEESDLGRFFQGMIILVAVTFLILELLALLSAAWMTRAVTGTVHKLSRATEFIKRGDFSHRVHVRSRDQLGELAVAFNEMSANIESLLHERVERERLEREVEIAAEVQAQLFPREVPHLRAAEIVGECRAARGVAGDYYDYIEIAPGQLTFALGDVAGKGISAALVMSNLQAALRAQTTILAERLRTTSRAAAATAMSAGSQVAELPCGVTGIDTSCAVEHMAASINEQLCRSTDSNRFVTLFIALYDDETRQLRYSNAGHNSPLLIRADGSIEQLTVGGTVLGAFDWARFEEASATLHTGDLLLVYSDGISEAQNSSGEEYGEERLTELARANRMMSADELRHLIFAEVDQWTGGEERGDDQTLVILKTVIGDG